MVHSELPDRKNHRAIHVLGLTEQHMNRAVAFFCDNRFLVVLQKMVDYGLFAVLVSSVESCFVSVVFDGKVSSPLEQFSDDLKFSMIAGKQRGALNHGCSLHQSRRRHPIEL